jgi:hypothetical protein
MEIKIMNFTKTFLGIEFGSTRIKAVLCDEDAKVLAQGSYSWENSFVDGHWTYIENQNYLYDAIYDFRKFYFEHHIKFISEIFSVKKAEKLIKTYSQYINKWFIVEHWRFNKDTLEFDEISNSKEVDEKGIEHPMENEIIKE